jgi:hypothetical protein
MKRIDWRYIGLVAALVGIFAAFLFGGYLLIVRVSS